MNGSIKQYEWFKRLNDRQVNEVIGLIDDWLIIDTEPIDSSVWLDRERWTNVDFVTIFVSGTVPVNPLKGLNSISLKDHLQGIF